MKQRCVIDEAIGETRAAVYDGKTIVEFYTRRWTEGETPRLGDRFAGRVRAIEKSLAAAFIDLGIGPDGFLKFTTAPNAPRLTEGLRIEVEITREAEAEKGPIIKFIRSLPDEQPGRLSGQNLKEFISARFPGITFETAKVGTLLGALETDLAIPGGGILSIERTKALTAIDIDSGGATSPFNVGIAACPLIAKQLRLRGIGGLIAIDFPNLRQRRQREEIIEALETAFEDDPNSVKFAGLSRFGVAEMTRSRIGASLNETLTERGGALTIETRALEMLRDLEKEGRVNPGAKLTMTVTPDVHAWLSAGHIDWTAPMTERLGARFTLQSGDAASIVADR
ncbi:MAG: ribonuclease E/G [Alphaproteobacteria bacterium]